MGDRYRRRWMRRPLGVATAAIALTACTSAPKQQEAAPPQAVVLDDKQQQVLDDYKAELEIGRTMSGRLLAFYGFVQDKQLTAYMNQVGRYVAKTGDFPDRRYMFVVLDSDTVNAFACPGGYILVTRGTLATVRNEAELAAILGHEAAHVGLQHMFNTLKRMNKDDADKLAKEAEARRNADPFLRSRQRPVPAESESGAAIAKFMTSASGAGLGVLQAAKAGMNLIMEKGLDQRLEFEADREGVKYAIRAGYEPKALDNFLARLEQEKLKKQASTDVQDKTHPPIPDRRKAIAAQLAKMDASQITGAVLQTRFEGFQSRLNLKKSKANDADKENEKESGT